MTKNIIRLITTIGLFLILSLNAFALGSVNEDVLKKAKATIGNFTTALENQKQIFGIEENDVVKDNITLDGGYEINIIDDSKLSNDEILFKSRGEYVFPIKLGNKYIGIAFADSTGVYDISSYKEFASDMENTKNIVKKELKNNDLSNDDSVKFIYDRRYYFSALTMNTPEGKFIVPLKDSGAEFKKGVKKTSKEAADIIKRLVTSNNKSDEIMLGSANSNNLSNELKRSYNYWYVIMPIVIVITLTVFYIKKRKLAINK